MNFPSKPLLFCLWLTACQGLPETFQAAELRYTAYRDGSGNALVPVARSVGSKRRAAWEKWLSAHRNTWNTAPNRTASGATLWCAQWQQNGKTERICNRSNQTLVWFGYGQTNDPHAIAEANKTWIGTP